MADQNDWMDNLWISIEDDLVTIGINEEAADELGESLGVNLPDQDDTVMRGKVCGDVSSPNGNINIYSPVTGTVVEVNEAILDNPELIIEDPMDEGWLLRVEADNSEDLDNLDDEDIEEVEDSDDEDEGD